MRRANLKLTVMVGSLAAAVAATPAETAPAGSGSRRSAETVESGVPIETVEPAESIEPTESIEAGVSAEPPLAADALLASRSPAEQRWLRELLRGNPEVARAQRLAGALRWKAPQVASLPDPVVGLSVFVLPVETRAGAQRLSASFQQRLPWFGKLALGERAAVLDAAAAEARVQILRLDQLAEARRVLLELEFHRRHEEIARSERATLERYERAAQARYASGSGLQQESVRIQAQITRIDTRLLEIQEHRAGLRGQLRRLAGGRPLPPADGWKPGFGAAESSAQHSRPDLLWLQSQARSRRPDFAELAARAAAAEVRVERARLERRPDVTVGASWTLVETRDDLSATQSRIEDDGDDVLALNASVALPVRQRRIEAAVSEAQEWRRAIDDERVALEAQIHGELADLTARLPLLEQHLELLGRVLAPQAGEALRSAETAYSTGRLSAVDLLDAEVVLLDVRTAIARTEIDLAQVWVRLEHVVGLPRSRLMRRDVELSKGRPAVESAQDMVVEKER